LEKILDGDPQIRRLLRTDSFDGQAPELIRVRVFEYRYTTRQERQQTGQWWWRGELGTLVSPSGLDRDNRFTRSQALVIAAFNLITGSMFSFQRIINSICICDARTGQKFDAVFDCCGLPIYNFVVPSPRQSRGTESFVPGRRFFDLTPRFSRTVLVVDAL